MLNLTEIVKTYWKTIITDPQQRLQPLTPPSHQAATIKSHMKGLRERPLQELGIGRSYRAKS